MLFARQPSQLKGMRVFLFGICFYYEAYYIPSQRNMYTYVLGEKEKHTFNPTRSSYL